MIQEGSRAGIEARFATTTKVEEGTLAFYQDLRRRGIEAFDSGRLPEAQSLFDQALCWAQSRQDPALVDLAFCNRSAVAIETGGGQQEVSPLREILMRNSHGESSRLAAYHVARAYELRKEFKKALFYARIARDHSLALERSEWILSSHNQVGNLLLAESHFEQACAEFELALAMMSAEPSVRRALILDNVGYCRIVQGRTREGFALLYESLRILRRLGARHYECPPRLSLCFAHLEVGRYRDAMRHGRRAVTLAEAMDTPEMHKNALYLLGEAATLAGDEATAQECFSELQSRFYPDAGFLPGLLLRLDVRKLLNLKA